MNAKTLSDQLDLVDGVLFWNTKKKGRRMKEPAGSQKPDGYIQICLGEYREYAHRIIFYKHHGHLPAIVDHIDGDPFNNDISNLREVTPQQSSWNRGGRTDTPNVYKNGGNFGVRVQGRYYGTFSEYELAELVAKEAREKHYGEFSRKA